MIAVAAIGSVGETTAPRTNAAAHGSPGTISCATTATTTIVRSTRPDREQPDRPQVRAQVAQRREEGGSVEQQRQHADEHEVGWEVDLGQAGHEAEREPAEHEDDRIRDPQLRREHQHRRACREQHEQVEQLVVAQVDQARPLSRNSRSAYSLFSSSRPMPRRISGVFVNWISE